MQRSSALSAEVVGDHGFVAVLADASRTTTGSRAPETGAKARLPSGSRRAREAWRRLLAATNEVHKRAVGS